MALSAFLRLDRIIETMKRDAIYTRDAALALLSRLNRWLIGGAIVLSGGISLVAARSFHGHPAATNSNAASAQRASSSSGSSSSTGSSSSGSGLQQPTQAPSSSAPSSPAPVVSGGS